MALGRIASKWILGSRAFLLVAFGGLQPLHAAELEVATILLHSSGMDAILRDDLAIAAASAQQPLDGMPEELRSALDKSVSQDLDYAQLQAEIAGRLASSFSSAALQAGVRWWTSDSGRVIAATEHRMFTAYIDPRRDSSSPIGVRSPWRGDLAVLKQTVQQADYFQFAASHVAEAAGALECLQLTMTLGPDCEYSHPTRKEGPASVLVLQTRVTLVGYQNDAPETLAAYLAYLQSDDGKTVTASLRALLIEVEKLRIARARDHVKEEIRRYVRARNVTADEVLRRVVPALDSCCDKLEGFRILLGMVRYLDERNPDIPMQIARIRIKQGVPYAYPYHPGEPPPVAERNRQEAGRWLDQALALDPKRGNTLELAGHLEYLNRNYDRSLELLEQARAAGATTPWLQIHLASSLWASGKLKNEKSSVQQAAIIFETALAGEIPDAARQDSYQQLADIYTHLQRVKDADRCYSKYVATFPHGENRGYALSQYAYFLLFTARDVDRALSAARDGILQADFQSAHEILAQILSTKSGLLFASGRSAQAWELLKEARENDPALSSKGWQMATFPATFPALRALHDSREVTDFSGETGGRILERAAAWAGAAEIQQLLAWGADPNFQDPEEGTPLIRAILSDNLPAVKMLLAHGASLTTRDRNGHLPAELTGDPADSQRAAILELLAKVAHQRTGKPAATSRERALRLVQSSPLSLFIASDLETIDVALKGLPDQVPATLFDDLRTAIERDLNASQMQIEIAKLVAQRVSAAEIENSLSWWSGASGDLISQAEHSAYTRGGSRFSARQPPANIDRDLIRQVETEGAYEEFIQQEQDELGASRKCLLQLVLQGQECNHSHSNVDSARMTGDVIGRDQMHDYVAGSYLLVPPADLGSYLHYLQSPGAKGVLATMRGLLLEVERRHLVKSQDDVVQILRAFRARKQWRTPTGT